MSLAKIWALGFGLVEEVLMRQPRQSGIYFLVLQSIVTADESRIRLSTGSLGRVQAGGRWIKVLTDQTSVMLCLG